MSGCAPIFDFYGPVWSRLHRPQRLPQRGAHLHEPALWFKLQPLIGPELDSTSIIRSA